MADTEYIYLECIKDGNKLRVRVISSGYFNDANCQFPRAIRLEGRKYRVPKTDVKFVEGAGRKYFYRVSKKNVEIINVEDVNIKLELKKIYEDEAEVDCIVCFANEKNVVLVPCGHYCLCNDCGNTLLNTTNICPLCRATISVVASKDQISLI